MGWIVKFLTENQDVQSRLRSELHSAYPKALQEHRIPTFEEVNEDKHPYMEAVIEEALRLHPTNVTRSAIVDTELLGHHIPKGTVVFSIANGPGCWKPSLPVDDAKRSSSSKAAPKPNSWDESSDLLTFDPERWLVKDDKGNIRFDGNRGPQLIFGLGPRGCYGKRLAYIEMRVLATLAVWNFDLLPTPPELSSHAATDGISHKAKQCYVKLKKTPL
jgi:cytochrome P450